jgi:demethylmenaquinone methyltransferase/2-methoxy-6-polyprenyl-1,4-benzoquinol methylase
VSDRVDRLLAEQLSYYRARAPEYFQTAFGEFDAEQLSVVRGQAEAVIDAFAPTGDVLELACGPGTWTGQLLRHASTLTALDGSPEMLRLAAERIDHTRVRFVEADLFRWRPDRAYDVVFFGFWLSHVPLERFSQFWSLVADCLKPAGRVLFIDDAYREPEELVEGEASEVIRRHLHDGRPFQAIKVPHEPEALQQRLAELGWRIEVRRISGPFYWGAGELGSRP